MTGIDCTWYLAYYEHYHASMKATFLTYWVIAVGLASLSCATNATLGVLDSNAIKVSKSDGLVKYRTELGKDQVFCRATHSISY